MVRRALLALLALVAMTAAAPAAAQEQHQVRLLAPPDCLKNQGCGVGLKATYKLDVSSVFVPLTVADAGISALDDGLGEVAVAFSSNPEISRPDIVTLTDDKHMIGSDHVVPIVRAKVATRYGKRLRNALNGASALLTTLQLRSLNQQVSDGRLAEAVGAEFIDANGLSGSGKVDKRRKVTVGYMDFDESQVLAWMYGEALAAAGFSVKVKAIGGLRPEAVAAVKSGKVDLYPGYSRSLADYLTGKLVTSADVTHALNAALKKVGAKAMAFARATDQNVFVVKNSMANVLGISKLSDLAKYWPAAS